LKEYPRHCFQFNESEGLKRHFQRHYSKSSEVKSLLYVGIWEKPKILII